MPSITKVRMDSDGDRQVVSDGGEVLVESGGEVNLESGATLAVDGTMTIGSGSTVTNEKGVGAINANTGLSLVEEGDAVLQKTVLTLVDTPITIADGSNAEFGGIKLYDFPEGAIQIVSAVADLAVVVTTISATADGDFSLATVVIDDSTHGAADANQKDILAANAIATLSSSAGPVTGQGGIQVVPLDGTAAAKGMYLNVTFDQGAGGGASVYTGTITVTWQLIGTYT